MNTLDNTTSLSADRNLTQGVCQKIKQMMLNYEIIPGQRLIFNDLAKQLGVSRTPVNNALSILANEGFVDLIPNKGYTLHRITKEEAGFLYEVREILELGSVGPAIRKLTPEKLNRLKQGKNRYEEAVAEQASRDRFIFDQEFHARLIEMSENQYLADYFREVYQRIFLRHRIEGLYQERARKVVVEHNEIFEAVELRDIESARELLKFHIKTGKEYIFSVIFD